MHGIIVLVGGFLLDCLLGDPHNPWHPSSPKVNFTVDL